MMLPVGWQVVCWGINIEMPEHTASEKKKNMLNRRRRIDESRANRLKRDEDIDKRRLKTDKIRRKRLQSDAALSRKNLRR